MIGSVCIIRRVDSIFMIASVPGFLVLESLQILELLNLLRLPEAWRLTSAA